MKKLLALLLCVLLCATPAFAESGTSFSLFPTPAPDEELPSHDEDAPDDASETPAPNASIQENTLKLSVLGKSVTLDFDPDPEYSLHEGGYIQASFYAYDADETLYELYLIFPDSVEGGSIVNPRASIQNGDEDSCVMLFVNDGTSEIYAVAAQMGGLVYPVGSDYAIRFTEVTRNGSVCTFKGTLSATLISLDESYNVIDTIDNLSASFHFTMDLSGNPAPSSPNNSDDDTSVTPQAPVHLVTPPDAKKI